MANASESTRVRNYQGIGAPLRRVEDRRFLLGRGRFVADIELPGALACVLVRSPHAHARIRRIDTSAAMASPGVVAVFTGADMAADGMAPMRPLWAVRSRDGTAMAEPPRFALARGTVRHVGEPVVAVIADTLLQATDAAERVEVDYEPLPAVTDARAAQAPRRAAAARVRARQRLLSLGARRRSRRARGVRIGRPHGRDRSRQQPPGRRGDRAARGDRHRRAGRRQAHALHVHAGAASHPPPGDRAARHPRERAARDLARCRRRLRLQGQALSGGGDRRLGRAPAGPPGALGGDPRRKLRVRQPGPRSPHPCASLRSTPTAISSRCTSTPRPISAPMSRPSAPPFRARSTAPCSPAATARPRSSSR